MTIIGLENQSTIKENSHNQEPIDLFLFQFERSVKGHAFLHGIFLLIASIEIFLLIFFFTFLIKSALLAFTVAILFLTFFGYLIVRTYLQTKQPEQFEQIKNDYVSLCRDKFSYRSGHPESHLKLATACSKLAEQIQGKENSFYKLFKWLSSWQKYMEMASQWFHWRDVLLMREMLLLTAIEEHIKLVICEPTRMMPHAALANSYVLLSSLYKSNIGSQNKLLSNRSKEFELKFRAAAERAIEEFKILNVYSPDDPWVHEQLAYSYRDLGMPNEEIREYETLLRLKPEETEILFKLGVRYFQQGFNGQGLRIYEQLKRLDFSRAEDLIAFYGAYKPFNSE